MIELDQKILEQILEIGGRMLVAGGEAKRVETAITRLCEAYGANAVDVFVITSSIVVTARFKYREALTQTKRISGHAYDLSELNNLNSLSREICASPVSAEEISEKIRTFKRIRRPIALKMLCWAAVSAAFAMFFGGSLLDGCVSAVIGMLLYLLKNACNRISMGNYFSVILCCLIGGFLSSVPSMLGIGVSQFYVSIGNIMLFIPGIALTNSLRDMFSGDTITGLLRFIEALIVSMAIAFGFAVFDVISELEASPSHIVQLLTALAGSLCLGIIFNAKKKTSYIGAVGGFAGWGAVLLCEHFFGSELLGYFIAAALITLSAEILARVLHCPTTLFIVIAILPLVPGKSLYVTMQYAIHGMWGNFASQGLDTLLYAIALSVGIIVTGAAFSTVSNAIKMRRK